MSDNRDYTSILHVSKCRKVYEEDKDVSQYTWKHLMKGWNPPYVATEIYKLKAYMVAYEIPELGLCLRHEVIVERSDYGEPMEDRWIAYPKPAGGWAGMMRGIVAFMDALIEEGKRITPPNDTRTDDEVEAQDKAQREADAQQPF